MLFQHLGWFNRILFTINLLSNPGTKCLSLSRPMQRRRGEEERAAQTAFNIVYEAKAE